MGYNTTYRLTLKKLFEEDQIKKISIESLMEELKNTSLSQEKILEKLQQIKDLESTPYVEVDEEYIMKKLREEIDDAKYALDEDGNPENSSKWYDYQKDFRQFSKNFPNWLFSLYGEGEESLDAWHCYFVNGKMQHAPAKIEFDDFDPKSLK